MASHSHVCLGLSWPRIRKMPPVGSEWRGSPSKPSWETPILIAKPFDSRVIFTSKKKHPSFFCLKEHVSLKKTPPFCAPSEFWKTPKSNYPPGILFPISPPLLDLLKIEAPHLGTGRLTCLEKNKLYHQTLYEYLSRFIIYIWTIYIQYIYIFYVYTLYIYTYYIHICICAIWIGGVRSLLIPPQFSMEFNTDIHFPKAVDSSKEWQLTTRPKSWSPAKQNLQVLIDLGLFVLIDLDLDLDLELDLDFDLDQIDGFKQKKKQLSPILGMLRGVSWIIHYHHPLSLGRMQQKVTPIIHYGIFQD